MEEPSLAAGPNGRGLGPGLATLPAGRRSILLSLKTRGEARAEELATDLGVTTSAVRQHLTALMRDGLVARGETRGGPGRPKHHYHLSRAADTLFPRTYPQVTNELLGYIGEDDPELLDRIFRRRRDRRIADVRRRLGPAAGSGGPPAQALEARVAELARILDEDGYVASWHREEDGSYRIVEHNCAILGIAERYGQACTSEIDFIRDVLPDAEVERVAHIAAGQRRCAYAVRPRAVGGD